MKDGKCSVLYAVPWIGSGTLFSESLCSYFYRLAYLHRVAPSTLYRAYVVPRLRDLGMGTHVCYQIQDGMGLSADSVVLRCLTDALVELTGVEAIRHGSLQGLAALVGHSGLAQLKRRYCPTCFAEPRLGWYGQALWEFQAVKACPLHDVRLVNEVCSDPTVRLAPSQRPQLYGVCRQCGSIGMACGAHIPIKADRTEIWVAREVGDLVAYVSGGGQLSRERLEAGLAGCIGRFRSRTALARRLHCSSAALVVGARGRPSLSVLLAVAAHCEVSLLSLFRGEPLPSSTPLHSFSLPDRVEPAWRSDDLLEGKLERLAEKYRALDICVESGAAVCRKLGVNRRFLARRCPQLWAQIVTAYRNHMAAELERSVELKRVRLLAAIETLSCQREDFTANAILRTAGIDGWQIFEMRKVLRSLLCVLGERGRYDGVASQAGRSGASARA
ncbi:TniQ family protein [Cupriavidus sp. amp6]|uniref:TniQ family protein n=1 Tax=Cupriavidus sp. amp6 TaxID=388051 RepID=UPI0003FC6F88|nr:TniQ family protein [Cupriavidus sp. amp6]